MEGLKSTLAVATADGLPEEILLAILSRLPAKSLVRFSCVHKSWHSLIKSPGFIGMHLRRSTLDTDRNGLAIICDHDYSWERLVYLVSQQAYHVIRVVSTPYEINFDYFRFVGCCNGVICLTVGLSGTRNYLLNPAIKEIKRLAKPNRMDRPSREMEPLVGLGFGFDHSGNDYKVVRIYDSFREPNSQKVYSNVDVYKLSTDSWRTAEMAVDGVVADNSISAVKVNNFLCWKGVRIINQVHEFQFIMSFDVVNEAFENILLPNNFPLHVIGSHWHPFVFKEWFSLVLSHEGGEGQRSKIFEIWVMKEFGNQDSWTRQVSLEDPELGVERVIIWGKEDEILYQNVKESRLIVYNSSSCETEQLKFRGRLWPIDAVNYVESIVTVKGRKLSGRKYVILYFQISFLICTLVIAFLVAYFT